MTYVVISDHSLSGDTGYIYSGCIYSLATGYIYSGYLRVPQQARADLRNVSIHRIFPALEKLASLTK